jgi:tripartite-type tricarboxylate transporter receptor subunit TctC
MTDGVERQPDGGGDRGGLRAPRAARGARGLSRWVAGSVLVLLPAALAAQPRGSNPDAGYPSRPIRFLVPLAAGGGSDFVSRLLAQRLTEAWGQQVVVDNRPGGSGIIATELLAKAGADGHTMLMTTMAHTVNPSLFAKLPYDSVKAFEPVILLAQAPSILSAHPSVPAANVKELVALAKARPGQISYASFGIGATSHLTGELLKHAAGIDLLHVPYKGAGEAGGYLLSGQVNLMFSSPASVVPHFKAGKLKALASTAKQRLRALPDLPTFAEQGYPEVNATNWYGVLVPAGTPKPVIAKLNGELVRILRVPEVVERMQQVLDAEPIGSTPAEFQAFLSAERSRWAKVIQAANIKPRG